MGGGGGLGGGGPDGGGIDIGYSDTTTTSETMLD